MVALWLQRHVAWWRESVDASALRLRCKRPVVSTGLLWDCGYKALWCRGVMASPLQRFVAWMGSELFY